MNDDLVFRQLSKAVTDCSIPVITGTITSIKELYLEAIIPNAKIGMRVEVSNKLTGNNLIAEVVSAKDQKVGLLPYGQVNGIGVGDKVNIVSKKEEIPCGDGLLSRIINSFGEPLDDKGDLQNVSPWPITRAAPNPLKRLPVTTQFDTGIKAIDGCLALGKGQRVGLFAGPGQGKTTLLGMLAKQSTCDVCVVCLVGERGREVGEFVNNILKPSDLKRCVIILAAADSYPLYRVKALETATAVAEWFRAKNKDVLLLVDSLTRVIRAKRDTDLALGEVASYSGYPVSALSNVPFLLERAGQSDKGSITGIYAVLTEDQNNDSIANEVKSLLDGHIILSSRLANAGKWPAIDIVSSVSRVMNLVVSMQHAKLAQVLKRLIAAFAQNEELFLIGAYQKQTSTDTDHYLDIEKDIEEFLRQNEDVFVPMSETFKMLNKLVSGL